MKTSTTVFIAIAITITAGGCMSAQPRTQTVHIATIPAGATIRDNGKRIGHTPYTAELSKTENHDILLTMRGYQPQVYLVKKVPWANKRHFFSLGYYDLRDIRNGQTNELRPIIINAKLKQN